ncbi:hypothetical protein CN917_03795 [Bacillus thuringiensis]|uniref:Uncharacterized protein n=3 Tax=Bacillus cereus group TaxID=86661 RepID=A0A9X7GDQ9_BACTU|nr:MULTISPECIES: hypothetical protein [Bacillus cereus group]AHX17911.1 hypothetical protein CY96_07835 [Bacillus bombysepticus str. Wang]MBV6705924.1 hypothetical protein [Bacillus thuringiensis]SFK61976.1 hypothetical protein SAMN04488573_101852 [Bacillus sp. 5mfcol3.1]EKS7866507.1 hypothetical protein [Bacillus cereus]MBG9612545.1 hypothetical protein [Bacillus cereus]
MKKQDIWDLTLPQLNYYLKKCHKHIEFTVKVHSMSFTGLFGGGSAQATEQDNLKHSDGKEVIDGYEVANADDMEWLAGIL